VGLSRNCLALDRMPIDLATFVERYARCGFHDSALSNIMPRNLVWETTSIAVPSIFA